LRIGRFEDLQICEFGFWDLFGPLLADGICLMLGIWNLEFELGWDI
jgi:hypothetical protein